MKQVTQKNRTRLTLITIGCFFALELSGCGVFGSSNDTPVVKPPYTGQLYQNAGLIVSTDTMTVTAMNNYPAPAAGQTSTLPVSFKVAKDLPEKNVEGKILIPAGTLVSGTYTNDGKICNVSWENIYAHGDQTMDKSNAVLIDKIAAPTTCNPATGIKTNDQLTINFTKAHSLEAM
ncbi:MAG: hypothetical protein K0R14_2058 [Burkholderiales bacterium]|jgi:hypothetical protein|nr:hypothetical protein [Burkholderiales bacterium]